MMNEQSDVKNLMNVLAEQLRSRRRVLGLTQEQLAERAGVSTNFLARLELGWKTPSLATLTQLASALNTRVSDLLAETDEQWLDDAQAIAHTLKGIERKDAEFAIKQFREIVDHFARHDPEA